MEKDGLVGFGAYKPPDEPFSTKAARFIYDPKQGSCLGRTPLSWIKILTFYVIFYTCLVSFFLLLMFVMWCTLDLRVPKYKMDSSLIGTSPGLGFRPMPKDELSTLISYKGTKPEDYGFWTTSLENFLENYKKPGATAGSGANIDNCGYDHPKKPGKVCEVSVRSWQPCVSENNFDYHVQQPCIFLKLNKIYGWTPETYELDELPKSMPEDLKTHIKEFYHQNNNNTNYLKNVWVSCDGVTPSDVEYLGEVEYVATRGYPYYYFPFENTEGYLSPLVAIHLPNVRKGIVINIECRAWAKNIKHDRKERQGLVQFELMLD